MSTNNVFVAALLRRLATVVSPEVDSRFNSRAYGRAAATIESPDEDVTELVQGEAHRRRRKRS